MLLRSCGCCNGKHTFHLGFRDACPVWYSDYQKPRSLMLDISAGRLPGASATIYCQSGQAYALLEQSELYEIFDLGHFLTMALANQFMGKRPSDLPPSPPYTPAYALSEEWVKKVAVETGRTILTI